MKLSTKIVLGFILTNIIFMILVGFVYVFMRPVQAGSNDLNIDVLPLLDEAAQIQYNSAMEGSMIRAYLINPEEETWKLVEGYHTTMLKVFDEVDVNFSNSVSGIIKTPEITSALQAIRRDYAEYSKLAQEVPARQANLMKGRIDILTTHDQYTETIKKYLSFSERMQTREINSGAAQDILNRRVEHLNTIRDVEESGFRMVISTMRAVINNDAAFFDEALGLAGEATSRIQRLHDTATVAEDRELAANLMANLRNINNVLNGMKQDNADSLAASTTRSALNANVTLNASKLREIGDVLAQTVAANSSNAVTRVLLVLFVGTAVAIVVSMLMAFFITRSITRPVNYLIGILSDGA